MPTKYWWFIGGIVTGFVAAPLLRKTPIVGSVINKLPTV